MSYRVSVAAICALVVVAIGCASTAPTAHPSSSPSAYIATVGTSVNPTSPPTQAPATNTPTVAPTVAPSASPAAASLLLEVTQEGGFIAPTARLGQVPTVVVDRAGDIYTADPNATGLTLIQPVVVRDVGEQGAAQILAAMRAAGLDRQGDDGGIVADTGVTIFTAVIDGNEVVNRVAENGGPGRPGASANPQIDLVNRLLDTSETWGAAHTANVAFAPTAYKIYVAPTTAAEAPSIEWPLATDLASFGTPATPDFGVTGLRTGVVADADAAQLAAGLGSASADTQVTSNGHLYLVWIRPLLPPEITQ